MFGWTVSKATVLRQRRSTSGGCDDRSSSEGNRALAGQENGALLHAPAPNEKCQTAPDKCQNRRLAETGEEKLRNQISDLHGTAGWIRTTDLRSHNPTL